MSEIEAAIKSHKKRAYNIYEEEKDDRKISQIFSKILISIIIILICTIYIKLSPDNLSAFKSIVFENSMAFNKINNLYHSLSQTKTGTEFTSVPDEYSDISHAPV